MEIKFEHTPRDSQQCNGKAECKIAVLTGRIRSVWTTAKFLEQLLNKLWAKAAATVGDVENLLALKACGKSPSTAWGLNNVNADYSKQLREVALIKTASSIKRKLANCGAPVIYLRHAPNHLAHTFCLLSVNTERILDSRDATQLNQGYGKCNVDKRVYGKQLLSERPN